MTRRLSLAVALLALASCSKCGKKPDAGAAGIEAVLPRGALAVVVVPKLTEAGAALTLLEQVKVAGFVAPLQGFPTAKAFVDEVTRQVGLDPRSVAELEKAGLDPTRSMAAAVLLTGDGYLVLPVKDAAALHARLEGISTSRFGAAAGGQQTQGEVTVKTFSKQQGLPPRLGYAIVGGWAFVGRDEMIPRLGQAAALSETDRLSKEADLMGQVAALPPHVVRAWLGPQLVQATPLSDALVTAALGPNALEVRVTGRWKEKPELLSALTPQAAVGLEGALPADAFLVGRYSGDARGLASIASQLVGPNLARAFAEGGFDLEAQVLEQVKPGAVFALSLADRPPMDRGVPSFDIRQTNPFSYAHLSGLAPVATAEVVMPTLEKVAQVAPRFGAKLEKQQREGKDVFFTTWSQGQGVHFAPRGASVAFASPVQRLDALLSSTATSAAPSVAAEALSVRVDLTKLAASVRALPESAWGLGGFALKPGTVRWLDATDDLKAVTVKAGAKDGRASLALTLELGLAQPAAPASP